eukprot:1159467-Pelagomonas_calceolata.AAC.13
MGKCANACDKRASEPMHTGGHAFADGPEGVIILVQHVYAIVYLRACVCVCVQVIMLMQTDVTAYEELGNKYLVYTNNCTDVTARVELENKLADLTDAQLSMLEQLFPRHIIEYMLARVPNKGDRNLRDLANMHEQVGVRACE